LLTNERVPSHAPVAPAARHNYAAFTVVRSPSAYTTAIKNMVVYGDETTGTKPLVPNLTTSKVYVNLNLDAAGMPRDVTVAINGYTIDALFHKYNLTNKPRVTTLYYGQVSCASC
jgi:hypothetical protein